jgi:hypothetical protein
MVQAPFDAISLVVQARLAPFSLGIEPAIDPVAASVQVVGAFGVALGLGSGGPRVQSGVDAITLCVQSPFCGLAALIQALVDALAAIIEPPVGAITAIRGKGGNRDQREQGRSQYFHIRIHHLFLGWLRYWMNQRNSPGCVDSRQGGRRQSLCQMPRSRSR